MKKQVCVWLLLVVVSAGTANLLSYTDLDSSPDQSPPVIWSLCNPSSNYSIKINDVNIEPWTPVIGKSVSVVAHTTFLRNVTGGFIKIHIFYNGRIYFPVKYLLCNVMAYSGVRCPVPPGPHTLKAEHVIPNDTPAGKYTGDQIAFDQNMEEAFCIRLDIELQSD